jgi:hypothetical protein
MLKDEIEKKIIRKKNKIEPIYQTHDSGHESKITSKKVN